MTHIFTIRSTVFRFVGLSILSLFTLSTAHAILVTPSFAEENQSAFDTGFSKLVFSESYDHVINGGILTKEALNSAIQTARSSQLLSGVSSNLDLKRCASLGMPSQDNMVNQDTSVASVPEPASLALLGLGLVALGAARKRSAERSS